MRVDLQTVSGVVFSTPTRVVTVVKPGGAEFLDVFDVSGARARIEGQEIIVDGVIVQNKLTQERKVISVRLQWFEHLQNPAIVSATE